MGAIRERQSPIPNAVILCFTGFHSFVPDPSYPRLSSLLNRLIAPASLYVCAPFDTLSGLIIFDRDAAPIAMDSRVDHW